MGHTEKPEHLNRRDALLLQRRLTTFLLVFSVVVVALMMTLAAVQNRDAACQDRAHEVVCDNLLRPDLTMEEIVKAVSDVLTARRAALDLDVKSTSPKSKTLEVLDTSNGVIAANGFRLLHRSDGINHNYELRAIFDALCGSKPTISMEVLANVDYEKVVYHTKAISMMNGTQKYMLESSLNTKDGSRITSFSQLQSLFPGFNALVSTGKLTPSAVFSYTGGGSGGQVYYNGQPLDVAIGIQQWFGKDEKPLFWRVTLSTESVFAENDLTSLELSLRNAFTVNNYTCVKDCGGTFNVYLR